MNSVKTNQAGRREKAMGREVASLGAVTGKASVTNMSCESRKCGSRYL